MKTINSNPILPRNQLDHENVMKILLSERASEALRAAGEYYLAIVTAPDATAPTEAHGRLVLVCVPLTKERAHDASLVALGRMDARRVKPVKLPPPASA